jgi:hypothetical protein
MSGPELYRYRKDKKVRQDDARLLETLGLKETELRAIERGALPQPRGFAQRFVEAVDRLSEDRDRTAA